MCSLQKMYFKYDLNKLKLRKGKKDYIARLPQNKVGRALSTQKKIIRKI